jgi:hypothetical protein
MSCRNIHNYLPVFTRYPCDFRLFSNLKLGLKSEHFGTIAVNVIAYLRAIPIDVSSSIKVVGISMSVLKDNILKEIK